MRKILPLLLLAAAACPARADETAEPLRITLMDEAVFYDGYNPTVFDANKIYDGILRHTNYAYAVPLADYLDLIGEDLSLDVIIGALCDNYDRIGEVNIALVPKGSGSSYAYDEVERIEIARFITPFMDKNKEPDEVPYAYEMPDVSAILRDAELRERYDLWLELEVFGVPYAANQQIEGCADRNDVFRGTVILNTNPEPAPVTTDNVLVPIFKKKSEIHGDINFNNYREGATDTIGVTTRTWEFEIPEDVADGQITFILSNHGANEGGEEYRRRLHLVYYDGELVYSYTPGGVSCEPYRVYNTQLNGIYGYERSDESWERSSNWCPGQAIPTRYLHLGAQTAGRHSIMIRVPKARFRDKQGDFRPSIYFQGAKEGKVPVGVREVIAPELKATFTRQGDMVYVSADAPLTQADVYTYDGRLMRGTMEPEKGIDLSGLQEGAYIITVYDRDWRVYSEKIIK